MNKKNIILRILSELNQYPKLFYSAVFLTLIISIVSVFRPVIVNHFLNSIQQFSAQQLTYLGLFLIILLILESSLQYINSILSVILGQKLVLKTRKTLYSHVLHLPISYFDKTPVGTIVTRVVSDMEAMNEIFSEGFTTILGSVLTIIIFIATMFYINVKLTLAVLSVMPLLILSVWLFKNAVQKSFTQVRNAVANLNRFIQERLTGMSLIQQFNAEQHEFEKFKKLNQQHRQAHIQSIWYYSIFFPILELLSSIAIALLIYTSSILKNVALGDLTFFIMMTQMLFRPLRMLADQLNTFQMGLVAADRVYQLLDEHIPQINDGKIVFQELNYGIEFKNVSFQYQDKQVDVLSNINLLIPAKKVTAIVGHTGSGKSTLVSLISRLYDIKNGEILIDHIPIQQYSLSSLRSKISVILQDPHLFNDTILNNVRMFDSKITLEQVENASKEIGIHHFIQQFENGYNYIIQERGNNLSSGQKQLIAFLRSYLSQPELFILDEATSMIDSHTEQLIQSALKKILHNRTAIIIAHRLSTIQMADQIVVMHNGTIVEQGTHNELIAKNRYYKEIYEAQLEEIA
ncbi:MAG: xenobiotic ABC transporter ATP-binding protein [Bacteroidia bacterium]|nr:MAG: xenobiotic ABC transporter ATP-binding protein [Bacteroidia bacterium]